MKKHSAPQVCFEVIKSIITNAVNQDKMIHQMDIIKSAFLHGELEVGVYTCRFNPRFHYLREKESSLHIKMYMYNLYRLKQASNNQLKIKTNQE